MCSYAQQIRNTDGFNFKNFCIFFFFCEFRLIVNASCMRWLLACVRSWKVTKLSNCDAHTLIHEIPQCWCNWSRLSKISTNLQLIWFYIVVIIIIIIIIVIIIYATVGVEFYQLWDSHVCVCVCVSGIGIACVLIKNIRKTLFIWQMSLLLSHYYNAFHVVHIYERWLEWTQSVVANRIHVKPPNAFEWQIEFSLINKMYLEIYSTSMSVQTHSHSTMSRVYLLAENRFYFFSLFYFSLLSALFFLDRSFYSIFCLSFSTLFCSVARKFISCIHRELWPL